jgi:hypothetical protein
MLGLMYVIFLDHFYNFFELAHPATNVLLLYLSKIFENFCSHQSPTSYPGNFRGYRVNGHHFNYWLADAHN